MFKWESDNLIKRELIRLLQEDYSPMDTPINIYLECTNQDTGIWTEKINSIRYSQKDKCLILEGEYEEDEY